MMITLSQKTRMRRSPQGWRSGLGLLVRAERLALGLDLLRRAERATGGLRLGSHPLQVLPPTLPRRGPCSDRLEGDPDRARRKGRLLAQLERAVRRDLPFDDNRCRVHDAPPATRSSSIVRSLPSTFTVAVGAPPLSRAVAHCVASVSPAM